MTSAHATGTDGGGVTPSLVEPLLTTTEVAAIFRVSRNTAARWADDGLIPSFRTPSGQRRFRESEVRAALSGGAVKPTERSA